MGPEGTGDPGPQTRPRRTGRQRAVVSIGAVLSVLTFALAAVVAWGGWKYHEIDRATVRLDPAVVGGATNYLVVGPTPAAAATRSTRVRSTTTSRWPTR